ncbi:IS4 family transposase [Microcoleus sp. Pol14C2]|uniref:IS4 family transposase n=1 Tax=unclassified Microcoleus TaxID=2642155 RepID=UPI002FCF3F61
MIRNKRINRDHAKKKNRPQVENEVIANHLEDLLIPAMAAQKTFYRQLNLRDRILTLPLMMAAILSLLWRDVAGVTELTRLLNREGFLWCEPQEISQQALSQRFLTFPAILFEKVFKELLPHFRRKWLTRKSRPLPDSVQFALKSFDNIWIADGSTLEALFKKLQSLSDVPIGQLAGKMGVIIDLVTHLPEEIWFGENPKQADTNWEEDLLKTVKPKTLLLLDRGFYHFAFWSKLISQEIGFITRIKKGASYQIERVLTNTYDVKDQIIKIGAGTKQTPALTIRLVQIRSKTSWRSYLTSVREPEILPPYVVADLYQRRWRIEDAFYTVKRLLNLSYLWTGSLNGIQLQIWATWLFYAVLVDLGDAVADELGVPIERVSLEMIYRGMYHFSVAYQKGLASDLVKYFAAGKNQDLGIVKRRRKPHVRLIISPFPGTQRSPEQFFFNNKGTNGVIF